MNVMEVVYRPRSAYLLFDKDIHEKWYLANSFDMLIRDNKIELTISEFKNLCERGRDYFSSTKTIYSMLATYKYMEILLKDES